MKCDFSETSRLLIKILLVSVIVIALLICFVVLFSIGIMLTEGIVGHFSVDNSWLGYEECVKFYENNETDLQTVKEYFEDDFMIEIYKYEGQFYFGSGINLAEGGGIEKVFDEFPVDDEDVLGAIERLFENGCECIHKLDGLTCFLLHKADDHIEGILYQGNSLITDGRDSFTSQYTVREINSEHWFYHYY